MDVRESTQAIQIFPARGFCAMDETGFAVSPRFGAALTVY